jgi:hypothetical protein
MSNVNPRIIDVSESETRNTTQAMMKIPARTNVSQILRAFEIGGTISPSQPPELTS